MQVIDIIIKSIKFLYDCYIIMLSYVGIPDIVSNIILIGCGVGFVYKLFRR